MTSIIENTCVMIRSAELALALPHVQAQPVGRNRPRLFDPANMVGR